MGDKKPTILCVDDEPKNLELLEAILVPCGYDVVMAADGEDALVKVSPETDLILLDIMMPKMNGFEVLKCLRIGEETRLIPIVMITALSETEDRVTALDAGCDDFISKPFDKVELVARVRSLLKLSYYRRQLDEKKKFEAVLNDIKDAIVVCDARGKVERMNAAAEKYFDGVKLSVDLISLLYDQHIASITKETLLATAKHNVFELVRAETDQFKALYLQANVNFVANPDGDIDSMVFVFRDFTAEKIEQTMKQDFLSLISHKLKTPITVLMSGLLMLQGSLIGPINDKQKKYIDMMASVTQNLNSLVDKLFGFVTIERDRLDMPSEDIVLRDRIEALVNAVAKADHGKRVHVSVGIPAPSPMAKINGTYFDLAVGSLIENAIKFNDKDVVKIDIKAAPHGDRVTLTVVDNGCGIPPEEREKVFDKFYQIEKSFTGNVDGAGLGLALVKLIVKAYGGNVTLESTIGKGSTFSFTLPT